MSTEMHQWVSKLHYSQCKDKFCSATDNIWLKTDGKHLRGKMFWGVWLQFSTSQIFLQVKLQKQKFFTFTNVIYLRNKLEPNLNFHHRLKSTAKEFYVIPYPINKNFSFKYLKGKEFEFISCITLGIYFIYFVKCYQLNMKKFLPLNPSFLSIFSILIAGNFITFSV